MFKIPHTNLYIDQNTLDLFLNGTIVTKDYEINGKYLIKLLNYNILQDKKWFLHLAHFKIETQDTNGYVYTKIIFKKFKKFGVSKENYGYIPILKSPISININNKEYRMLIRYPKYYISCDGEIYDSGRKLMLKHYHGLMVYPVVYLTDQTGGQKSILVHRLVALAWVKNNDYYNNNVIDHKDNNKLNCNYKNLQWCGQGANVSKRYTNTIKDTIITRNIDTGEILKFINMGSCSNALFNTKIDTNHSIIRFGKIWKGRDGRYEIYKLNNFNGWAFENGEVKPYNLQVLKNDKHFKYFKSITELQKYIQVPTRYNIMETMRRINNKYLDNYILINLMTTGKYKNDKIYIYDIVNKQQTAHDTVSKASEFIGCSESVIFNTLKLKRFNKIINNKYICTNDKNIDLSKIKPVFSVNVKKTIEAKNQNDTIMFPSLRNLKQVLNVDYKTIHKYIKLKKAVTINNKQYILNYVCPLTQ